jgi:HlyD family secretion protein
MNIQTPPSPVEIETALGLDRRSRRRRSFGRVLWLAVVALAVAGLGWWLYQTQSQTSAMVYETAPAARADLVVTVTATGKIQPITQVDVSSELSGVVRTVRVDDNSEVKRGDVLAELDTTRLKAQLQREEANVAAAKAKLADAMATMEQRELAFNRLSALNKKGISAGQDFDTARADRDPDGLGKDSHYLSH